MRRLFVSLFVMVIAACAFAQTAETMVVQRKDGTTVRMSVDDVDKVYFEAGVTVEYVDLGLPSGLKWASCNLGASKPEEFGDYYGWGCTEPYAENDNADFALYFEKIGGTATFSSDAGTPKDPLRGFLCDQLFPISSTKWDAARMKLGDKWRLPQTGDYYELFDENNCSWSMTEQNGVTGVKIVSKKNGSSIFLPAAGFRAGTELQRVGAEACVWLANPRLHLHECALFMGIEATGRYWSYMDRCNGLPIRAVYDESLNPEPIEPDYVDLGLPSGVKWATRNLGAKYAEDGGDYYGWGCTEPYSLNDKVDYPTYFLLIGGTGTSRDDCGTDKDPLKDYVYPNDKSIAGTEWDAAHVNLGGDWRMPTSTEIWELVGNCTWEWTERNGIYGNKVTSKVNGNSIFLPAASRDEDSSNVNTAGCYWTASPRTIVASYYAEGLVIMPNTNDVVFGHRFWGYNIRPVRK